MARSRALRRVSVVGRGDVGIDEGDGGGFADDAGGGAVWCQINLGALGGFGCCVYVCSQQRGGVGDDDVAVGAVEDGGVAAVTASRSWRVGRVLLGHFVWSQPAPRIHCPGWAVAA